MMEQGYFLRPPRKGVMFLEGHSRHQGLIFGGIECEMCIYIYIR